MRIPLVSALLLASALAGCGSGGEGDDSTYVSPIAPGDVIIPANAALETIDKGLALVWNAIQLPHAVEVTVPQHATMVRAVAESGATSVSMTNLDTGRRRCNNPTVEDFSTAFGYPKSCSSIAALDGPGAVWRVNFAGSATGNVRVEFLSAPYDGLLPRDVGATEPGAQRRPHAVHARRPGGATDLEHPPTPDRAHPAGRLPAAP